MAKARKRRKRRGKMKVGTCKRVRSGVVLCMTRKGPRFRSKRRRKSRR